MSSFRKKTHSAAPNTRCGKPGKVGGKKKQNGAARSLLDPAEGDAAAQALGAHGKEGAAPADQTAALETSFEILATMLGFQAARQLTAKYGGHRIYLPDRVMRTHPLAKLMGWPAAKALCAQYAPGWVAVPLGPNATALQRRQRVQVMTEAGYTIAAIAKTLGVHSRTVERHRAVLKAEAMALEQQQQARMDQAIYAENDGGSSGPRDGVRCNEGPRDRGIGEAAPHMVRSTGTAIPYP